ncbi:hypothetical protein L7F22_037553 [Adiantum nelumboides]|nr:hypothetical protein [Adiantum nelumboides]
MSSSLQQGLAANSILSNPTHERFDVKRKFRKRKNFLNRYGASKRRKIVRPPSRKQVPSNEQVDFSNSRATERYSLSNAALNSGPIKHFQASRCTPEHDGSPKNISDAKQMKHADLDCHTDFGANSRVMVCSQAAQLDTADVLLSSMVLPSSKPLEPVSQSACDNMQSTSDIRVLRPRRVRNKEIKENVPPLADLPLIVGRRIEVYWPLDAAWYRGLVSAYDNVRKKHKVSYDDGEEEWLCLAREKFKYEMPSKSESVQSGGKAKKKVAVKDGKARKDSLSILALPSSSPQADLNTFSTRNGLPKPLSSPVRKLTASSTKIISAQLDAMASKVLSSESSFEAKATDLSTQKETKICIRRSNGISLGLRRGKTEVDGFVNREGGFVYARRERQEVKSRIQAIDMKKKEATKRHKGSKGQDLQETAKCRERRNLDTHSKSPVCHLLGEEECQNTEKLDRCALEDGNVVAALQEVQPKIKNARRRKRLLSNDEGSWDGTFKGDDDMLDVLKEGHSSSEGLHKRTRRKHKVKSLAHTAFAVKQEVGSLFEDERLSRDKKADALCLNSLPAEGSRVNWNSGDLELGSNKKLERRKPKRGARLVSGYIRGRGRLRRVLDRTSSESRPTKRHQGSDVETIKHTGWKKYCHQFLGQENAASLPGSHMDAASMNCKSLLNANIPLGTVTVKRSSLGSKISQSNRLYCSKFYSSLERNGRLSSQKAFHSTIHVVRPNVVFGLFTWQLFNMLEAVELSESNGFEGRFQWKGSTRDLANIALLFMSAVRSVFFINQKCHQCWQGSLSHDLWSVFSRKEQWSKNLTANLSPEADYLLMQHVRKLISAHSIVNMTSRQMLNIFSSYILKPYIVAILCEKGAQLRVVVQQYLLASCPLQDGICFKRQFGRSIKLMSRAGAEADFVSCLVHLSAAQNPGMDKIRENWIASIASVGHAQLPIPNPSFKMCRNQGLHFITASVVSAKGTFGSGHSILRLEQIRSSFGTQSWRLGDLLLPGEVGDLLSHGRLSCFLNFQRLLDFYTSLCFASILQKWLDSPGSNSVASDHCSKKLLFTVDLVAKRENELDSRDWERESRMDFIYLDGVGVPAEANIYTQISPERITPVAVKEEFISPGAITQLDKGTTSNALMRSSPVSSLNDLAYSASGSSSCSSEECSTKWKTTKMADISFRPHGKVERKGIFRENRYMTSGKHFKKRAGPKRRPRGCEEEIPDMQQLNMSCSANILLSNETRSWREFGVRVELQSRKSEWVVVVEVEGASYSHKVVESTITSRVNRFTHAMMWKGGVGWILEFCDRMQWILFKRMHEECGHRNARAAFVKQIPIPFVKQIDVSSGGRPSDTILFAERRPGEVENALDCTKRVYDMDTEDERWLALRNQRAEERVSMETFERIIDKLERITFLRQGEMVAPDEVAELCENMASEDAVLAVHHHWSEKRTRKDNALIRYFESPLPRKYQRLLDNWQQRMEELECRFPDVSKEELQIQYPQPPLFAFCWPSRGLDSDNVSKRLQRQRPQQKHLNAVKFMRSSSFDTSEETQSLSLLRSQRVHDLDWYRATQRGDYWQRKMARDGFLEHLATGCRVGNADCSSLHQAQANAAAARQSAQMYLLRFDSTLQRAVSAIIDFESTYIAELGLMSESTSASYEHLLDLRKRINRVMNQFSSLARKEEFLEDNSDLEDGSDDPGGDEEENPSWTATMHEESFGNTALSLKDEGTFLSLSERAHLEAWMRSTLRQRAC